MKFRVQFAALLVTVFSLNSTGFSTKLYDLLALKAKKIHNASDEALTEQEIKQIKSRSSCEEKLKEIDRLRVEDQRFNQLFEDVDTLFAKNVLKELKLDNLTQKDKDKQLCEAAEKGQVLSVDILLRLGANANAKDCYNHSPLNYATECISAESENHAQIVEMLIQYGAKVNKKSGFSNWMLMLNGCAPIIFADEYTALHFAASSGNLKVMEVLIKNGAKLDARDRMGLTPLHYAAHRKDAMRLLLEKGAQADLVGKEGHSLMHFAVYYADVTQNTEVVEMLLERGVQVNTIESYGSTPLDYAVRDGNIKIAEKIRAAAALETEKAHDLSHETLANLALKQIKSCMSCEEKLEEIDCFCAKYRQFNQIDVDTSSMERILQELKLDSLAQEDKDKQLHKAAVRGRIWLIDALLRLGTNVDVKTEHLHTVPHYGHVSGCSRDYTALHLAAEVGNLKTMKVLIENGTDLNARDSRGWTPLHYAAHGKRKKKNVAHGKKRKKAIMMLLENGAQANPIGNEGDTLMHRAVAGKNTEVVEMLIEQDAALLNAKDLHGYTPLDYAVRDGNTEIAKKIIAASITQ